MGLGFDGLQHLLLGFGGGETGYLFQLLQLLLAKSVDLVFLFLVSLNLCIQALALTIVFVFIVFQALELVIQRLFFLLQTVFGVVHFLVALVDLAIVVRAQLHVLLFCF